MGLSGTISRYFRKLVHRFVAESPKAYSTSFWLQMFGVLYFSYIFLMHWSLGLLTNHWILKSVLLVVNAALIALHKTVMIEQSLSTIMRDTACLNVVYLSYMLAYPFAGYPWYTFALYMALTAHHVIGIHYVDQLSPLLHNSIGILFNDPENLDELVRLNINDQLEGTNHEFD